MPRSPDERRRPLAFRDFNGAPQVCGDGILTLACPRPENGAASVQLRQPIGMAGFLPPADRFVNDVDRRLDLAGETQQGSVHAEIDWQIRHRPKFAQKRQAILKGGMATRKARAVRLGPPAEENRQAGQGLHFVPLCEIRHSCRNLDEPFEIVPVKSRHRFGIQGVCLAVRMRYPVRESDHSR